MDKCSVTDYIIQLLANTTLKHLEGIKEVFVSAKDTWVSELGVKHFFNIF